jgi:sugar lactone lactonase YvrE/enterochelin esterase-like enzyme
MRSHFRGACLSILLLIACATAPAQPAEQYKLGPDSQIHPGVPQGKIEQFPWTSKIFNGTHRDCWVYIPAQYDGSQPACVMVFQDGGRFVKRDGQWRAPVVMDNLIHRKEMPVTIGIFLDPGVVPADSPKELPRYNRSFEYDSPTDQYARFLLQEILPEVGRKYRLTQDGNARGICGSSSGGICAFTAAWERPREFSRVITFVGSFTDLKGGNRYPDLIRKNEPRSIRIFQQDGRNDLDIYAGSWFIANTDVDAALSFAGYEHTFVVGTEGHNAKHGGAILPGALRYVWKGYPEPVHAPKEPTKQPVMEVLIPGEEWQVAAEGFKFTEGPAADAKGNVFFTDIPNNRIHRIDAETGKVTLFAENTNGANGLMFGPDGKLYAAQKRRVVAYDTNGTEETVADEIQGNDLVVGHDGAIYLTEPPTKQVWNISPDRNTKKVVGENIAFPNGIILTPDQSQLIIADMKGANLVIYQIKSDGTLKNKQHYFSPQMQYNKTQCDVDGLTMDAQGRLYATSPMGLQVFDQAGRVTGIINKPQDKWLANVTFGGRDMDTLYAACADKVFKRKTKVKGVRFFDAPILPEKPKL